jgi:hypothetical protein
LARCCYQLEDYGCVLKNLGYLEEIDSKEFEKSDFAMLEHARDLARKGTKQGFAGQGTQTSAAEDTSPPKIVITSPQATRGIKLVHGNPTILIQGFVEDESGLEWIKINGESISFSKKGEFSRRLFLNIGDNEIEISAMDRYANKSETSLFVQKQLERLDSHTTERKYVGGEKQMYAVIIGIGEYSDQKIPPLRYAVPDARAVYETLTDSRYGFFHQDNVRLLTNAEATTRNIKRTIGRWLKEQARGEDTVLIYFAGHGAPEGGNTYWVTHDADIDNLFDTSLSNDDVSGMLKAIDARVVLCFLDSCYSAATVNRGWHTRSLVPKDPFKAFKGKGRVVITSSDGRQKSLELHPFGHGVFTYYFLEGIKGRADQNADGFIVLDEIWDYVKSNVRETAHQYGIYQTPIIDGRHSEGVLISRYPRN